MSFKDLKDIKLAYETIYDDVVGSFYIPALERAVSYKRAVGFFSSNILLQLTKGLGSFADNHGKMKLILSPKLEKEDYLAIVKGYEDREKLENEIINQFDFTLEFDQKEDRFKMLSFLISNNLLEIKLAIIDIDNASAMFHEKIGIMEDGVGNQIAFSGSANETYNGYNLNYENIDVFCSWVSEESKQRCLLKDYSFDKVWNGTQKGITTIPIPEAIKRKILSYKAEEGFKYITIDENYKKKFCYKNEFPSLNGVSLYDYQLMAIDNWKHKNYCGIFDMATGTGKTYTAGGAICNLLNDVGRAFVIICCPFVQLVDQWQNELKAFNISALKCYNSQDYDKRLERKIRDFEMGRSNFECVIFCNATFRKKRIQDLLSRIIDNTLLLVDEAHNFGSKQLLNCLKLNYRFRLALSATINRYGDEKGTSRLFDFFGEKCIEYTLERAIIEGRLTSYYYYPIVVYLNDDELDEYCDLTNKLSKYHGESYEENEIVKQLLIKRSRIIAGAKNKIDAFKREMIKHKNETNILVYCGAVKYENERLESEADEKQIRLVLNQLNDLGVVSTKYTSDESNLERNLIFDAYKQGDIQALVAIKCLDEGFNIPSIKTAFILASSTNPKEYIQRRGRVLRKCEGKEYAIIYDFVTLPIPLNDGANYNNSKICASLAKREMKRMIEFASLSRNYSDSNNLIDNIKKSYNIDIIEMEKESYV